MGTDPVIYFFLQPQFYAAALRSEWRSRSFIHSATVYEDHVYDEIFLSLIVFR
jgi:hypothetical protein